MNFVIFSNGTMYDVFEFVYECFIKLKHPKAHVGKVLRKVQTKKIDSLKSFFFVPVHQNSSHNLCEYHAKQR